MMIQDINMVGRERLAFLYGLYSGCAKSETELNIKGIYQEMTLLPDEDDQQSAWSVRLRKRKVRLVAAVGRLLLYLVDCNRAG